jgi:hypothetical protein
MATDTLGESTKAALSAANTWLAEDTARVENIESKHFEPLTDNDEGVQNL